MNSQKLNWEETYSVGVAEIDNQHKQLFATINELLDAINTNSPEETLGNIIEALLQYKNIHFDTEEKYFKQFNYEGTEEHLQKHREFSEKLNALKEKYPTYNIEFAFALVDFLENWLIDHLMTTDQKYKNCFQSNGLK
jgi:hemerythrin-like metal-binding protein